MRLGEDFQEHRFVAEREERQAAARGVERFDRGVSGTTSLPNATKPSTVPLGPGGRALRASLRALAGRFEDRDLARREPARVQLDAGRQVEVDVDQRRRESAVFGAGDLEFGFDRRAGAVDVAGVREAGIGTAFALNWTVGTADATPGSASARTPRAAAVRLMIALRIPVLLRVDGWRAGGSLRSGCLSLP